MNEDTLEYDSLADTLAEAGVISSLSEIHGGICGVMCVGGIAAVDRWLDRTMEEWQPQALSGGVADALRGLELNTWRMLSDTEMSFEPLLPGDDEPLDTQVRGLALWCHGFLTGLGFGGMKAPEGTDNSDLDEITHDFAEISRAAVSEEDAEDAEQSGFALAELKEYVRVSVQLVFERFEAQRPDARGDRIH
ncbi:MAG: UPF0149 family protein [Gammaproteobacteria bacterium]|nr:UPF0149 family protein [Gammaproteobacteria bacterium]